MNVDIIWLNGTSSSGKTTISKELQRLLGDVFLHVCFDSFYRMLPERFNPSTEADSGYVERVHLGFEYSIPALVKAGNRLIVDYPFHYEDSLPRCLDLVSAYRVLYVGVFASLEILESREAARGDRRIGLARRQSAIVHVNSQYDLEVDTEKVLPDEGAQAVIAALHSVATPTAFDRLRSEKSSGNFRSDFGPRLKIRSSDN